MVADCFHGVGHGVMLLAMVRSGRDAISSGREHEEPSEGNGRVEVPTACEPLEPLSWSLSPGMLALAERQCSLMGTRWASIQKYCFSGMYMTFFEFLHPVSDGWQTMCARARCPAACVLKCREFGRMLFPNTTACYGDGGENPITPKRIAELDGIFRATNGDAHAGSAFSQENEALIIEALARPDDTGPERTCF